MKRWDFIMLATMAGASGLRGDEEKKPPLVIGRDGPLGEAVKLPLPEPTAFEVDGRKGWKIALPENRPLATPAVVDGVIYIGGGFGSHEFYAIDAQTGKLNWGYRAGDDGPTAAVVSEGVVAYNTESCTIYAHDAKTGKLLWCRWMGDPIMSQPAIYKGHIYMAYPAPDGHHHLACLELKTGKPIWDAPITGEIITAPVAVDEHVYCACNDGTVFKFGADGGKLFWSEMRRATSAPCVVGDQVFVSQAHDGAEGVAALKQANWNGGAGHQVLATGKAQFRAESLSCFSSGDAKKDLMKNAGAMPAPYLQAASVLVQNQAELEKRVQTLIEQEKEASSAERKQALNKEIQATDEYKKDLADVSRAAQSELAKEKQQDTSVAFAVAPAEAKIYQAQANIGKESVCGVWSFQGSRALVRDGKSFLVQGALYRCIDNTTGKVVWEHALVDKKESATRPVTPPSEAGGKHYFGTTDGEILCCDAIDGAKHWKTKVGGHIVFQPAVVKGSIYIGTQDGMLICLHTGDVSADGWTMWGANAAHDGKSK